MVSCMSERTIVRRHTHDASLTRTTRARRRRRGHPPLDDPGPDEGRQVEWLRRVAHGLETRVVHHACPLWTPPPRTARLVEGSITSHMTGDPSFLVFLAIALLKE